MKKLLILTCAAAVAAVCQAGVKYWDNPGFRAYDVGDYVQDGLVVNYDGIRNAGPNAPHDSAAMTWVNSANPGTYDATRYSTNGTKENSNAATAEAWNNDASKSSWTDDGFVFNSNACFHVHSSFYYPKTYTIQSLVDTKPGNLSGVGYIMSPYYSGNDWAKCSFAIRSSGFNYGSSSGSPANTFYLVSGSIGTRPAMRGASSIRFSYATAIQNVNDGVIFSETTAPWDAPYVNDTSHGRAYDSSKSGTAYTLSNGFSIGGHYPATHELFKGTIKNYRFYNRCLSDAEVLWNRVVDEARYFGRGREITVIPVTNVVESCTIAGVRDYHYAIDAEGQTFTAPASKTVNGKRHVLSGYTLEAWNGTAWGASVSHDGEFSYTATDTNALVRITWQYTAASGEGKLKTYDVGDYVAGAAVHFDGIRNAGASADHDPNATIWKNLGSSGIDLVRIKYGYGDLGGWDCDGYWFTDTPKFTNYLGKVNWPQTYSVQVILDAETANQQRNDTAMYVYAVSWNRMAMAIYGKRKDIELQTQKESAQPYGPYLGGTSFSYVNGFVDANAMTSAIFSATSIPTSGNNVKGYTTMDSAVGTGGIGVGGFGGAADQDLVGKIKSIRFYFDKVLTEAELEQNRKVDEYRFFGRYVVTNVLVQSTYSYLNGYDACGAYEVDGSYTFTAPATVTAPNGITYACDGYIIEKRVGQAGWELVAERAGNSYRYETSPDLLRLTWKWKAVSGLRTSADYDFDDYSPAGLRLHYDGLLNAGVGVSRNTTATKWVNLGSDGAAMDLTLNRHSSDNNQSAWGEQGYDFAGHAQFQSSATMWTTNNFTAQAFVDAAFNDNTHASGNYIAAADWSRFGMQIWGASEVARFHALGEWYMDPRPRFTTTNGRLQFVTAIQNDSAKTTTIFPGTSAPTSGTATDGFRQYTACTNEYSIAFRLGGWGGGPGTSQCLTGTLNNFRYYDRVLTEEELVRNRNVDAVRYFGELGVTNVFVVAGGTGAVQAETNGAYKVEGSWTFTATKTVDKKGAVVDVVRHKVEELVNGEWTNKRVYNGNSYTYTEGTDPATVRLTWLGQPLGTKVVIK